MALGHSPKIVTQDLDLYFDAANTKCYPGSGTTWTDMTGNGYGGSLVGGANVTFVGSDAGGALDFDTSLITDVGYISCDTSFDFVDGHLGTWDWWVKWRSGGRTGLNSLAGISASDPWYIWQITSATSWYFRLRDDSTTYNNYTTVTTLDATNWTNLVLVIDGAKQAKLYINGEYQSGQDVDLTTPGTRFPMRRIAGGYLSGSNEYNLDGRMGCFRFYRRDLNSNEILQNFHAMKTRFGVSQVGI